MTFLTNFGVFSSRQERWKSDTWAETLKLKFLEKISANKLTESDGKSDYLGLLNGGGKSDLLCWEHCYQ